MDVGAGGVGCDTGGGSTIEEEGRTAGGGTVRLTTTGCTVNEG